MRRDALGATPTFTGELLDDRVLSLVLPNSPGAVARARTFVAESFRLLDPSATADMVDDARLVVSELVSNALLHAGAPVQVRVIPLAPGVRLEVQDPSSTLPLRARPSEYSMTGRGMTLVEALATNWGVATVPTGKVVWCDLGAAASPSPPVSRTLPPPDSGSELLEVHLGDVPTDLLLAAKAHVDNLVREFTLLSTGAASGATAPVPEHLASLVETVTARFSDARHSIKRQALEAADAGLRRTDLVLRLPASAADAGDAYLRGLDESDSYARALRLLTLESPPTHRAFRRWYVTSLVSQLRALDAGAVPPEPPTFEEYLLGEVSTLADLARAADRSSRLQAVTSALAAVGTLTAVSEVVATAAVEALSATAGALLLPQGDHLYVAASVGYASDLTRRLEHTAQMPAAVAFRGTPVWVESRLERDKLFPELASLEPSAVSICAVPLRVVGAVVGVLRLSFAAPRLFGSDERHFIEALAASCSQALERSSALAAEHAARAAAEELAQRLARLQAVTAELTLPTSRERIADIVTSHASGALGAQVAMVHLVDGPVLRLAASRAPELSVQRWATMDPDGLTPAATALRTGVAVVIESAEDFAERFPSLERTTSLDLIWVCVPLLVGDRPLGVISLGFPPSTTTRSIVDPGQLTFLSSLADASAQALDRAEALERAQTARDRLAFLDEASRVMVTSLDYRATLNTLTRLVVPRLADWCVVHLFEDTGGKPRFEAVAALSNDPAKTSLALEVHRHSQYDLNAPRGVPAVVRTGKPEVYQVDEAAVLADSRLSEETRRIVLELGMVSMLLVPLTTSSGTFGAVAMAMAESNRHYGDDELALASELARRAAGAVENAYRFQVQSGRLQSLTHVADATQQAILAPIPKRAGTLALSGAYVSAATDALVGGDLYEVVSRPGTTRLLLGDVRGKGLDAVRLTTVVLGFFRASVDEPSVEDVARYMDAHLLPYLGPEDFVTAIIAEVTDGVLSVVSCGHPAPVLARHGHSELLDLPPALPLGLGTLPASIRIPLELGDRIIMYTDGLSEARSDEDEFLDPVAATSSVHSRPLDEVPAQVLDAIRAHSGSLSDDLALLVAEYDPRPDVFRL